MRFMADHEAFDSAIVMDLNYGNLHIFKKVSSDDASVERLTGQVKLKASIKNILGQEVIAKSYTSEELAYSDENFAN